jgi:hypothetical protein
LGFHAELILYARPCCAPRSIGTYVAARAHKPCAELDEGDVVTMRGVLEE